MLDLTLDNMVLVLVVSLFVLGFVSIICGICILLSKTYNGDIKEITKQTTRLAQKGLAEDVAGLVGNASSLIEALNQMVKTATGVGGFLMILGLVMLAGAYLVLSNIL
jgi:hypothetical protein